MNKKKKKKNEKGFTLVELLAVITILGLMTTIVMYFATGAVKKAKQNTYYTTINEIEKAAANYLMENSDELKFIALAGVMDKEYQCVKVKELVDYGFLDNNVVESNVSEDTNVSLNDKVYLERNSVTKTLVKNSLIVNSIGYDNICAVAMSAKGDINFEVTPKVTKWSIEKKVTINYRVFNNRNNVTYNNGYEYDENYWKGQQQPETIVIKKPTEVYAYISRTDDDADKIVEKTQNISNIDLIGPTVNLKNSSEITAYYRTTVKVPLIIKDCDEEGVNCSGLKSYSNSELASMITNNKIVVIIGDKTVSNDDDTEVTFELSNGDFLLSVDVDKNNNYISTGGYGGKLKIVVSEDLFCDKTVDGPNCNEKTTLEPNIIFDFDKPSVSYTSTENAFVNEQTLTLTCSDNYGLKGYYIGTSKPSSTTVYTDLNGKKTVTKTKEITSFGKYYLSCKDVANNVTTKEVKYFSYSFKNMLLNEDGVYGTFNLENYSQDLVKTYLMIENSTISSEAVMDFIYSNVPVGSSSSNYRGYHRMKTTENVSNDEILDVNYSIANNDFVIDDNYVYMLWFDRNLLYIRYKVANNEDLLTGSHSSQEGNNITWESDNGYVKKNTQSYSTIDFQKHRYVSGTSTINLYNNSTSGWFAIQKVGYEPKKNEEWKCINGCKTSNMTFNQSTFSVDISESICDIRNSDCYIELAVNWKSITYNIEYSLNNGSWATDSSHPSSASYNQTITINNPQKTITFKGHANSTGATVGSDTTAVQVFNGWKIANSTKYDENELINRLSFINLRNSISANPVTMTAYWTSNDTTLPTVELEGYTCGWNKSSSGTDITYDSGGTYPGSSISVNAATTINLYAVCKLNIVSVMGNRCNKDDNTIYHITTCESGDSDSARCNYDKKIKNGQWVNETGTVLRSALRTGLNQCKLDITYNCQENGGSTANSTVQVGYGNSVDLNKTCTKSGWTFVGWNTDKNATTKLDSYTATLSTNIYAIYSKLIVYNFNGNGFGISVPSDTSGREVVCSDANTCQSKCYAYNKATYCLGYTPSSSTSEKTYYSENINSTSYSSSADLWRSAGFRIYVSKNNSNWYIPNDIINGARYWCKSYSGTNRLRVYYVTTCNGTTCKYTYLNGISINNASTYFGNDVSNPATPYEASRAQMSTAIGTACFTEYYINPSSSLVTNSKLPCYEAAYAGTKVADIPVGCSKIESFRTTRKVDNNGNNWYYVADKGCYINGGALQSAYPSACSSGGSGGGSSGGGNGSYYADFDSNYSPQYDGLFCSWYGNLPSSCSYLPGTDFSGCYKKVRCYYTNKFYLSGLKYTLRRTSQYEFSYWSYRGSPRYSYIDAEESGSTLIAEWKRVTSSGSGGGCFLKGTKVVTNKGYKDINKVKVGDIVLTYNEATGNNEYHKVTQLFAYSPDQINERLYTLKFDDKSTLKVSSTHRFYIKRNGKTNWVATKNLRVGDIVMYSDKTYHRITSIKNEKLKDTVYNLSVDNTHNFYVGDQEVLVHNVRSCDGVGCSISEYK